MAIRQGKQIDVGAVRLTGRVWRPDRSIPKRLVVRIPHGASKLHLPEQLKYRHGWWPLNLIPWTSLTGEYDVRTANAGKRRPGRQFTDYVKATAIRSVLYERRGSALTPAILI